jgi:hypothetical protein
LEQGSDKYSPIIIENDVSDERIKNSYQNKKSLYGITREQFDALVVLQGTACGSCGDDATGSEHTLHVDHCHNTQEIRGLLCSGCNTAAGWLDDDPVKAEKLADYLRSKGTGIFTELKTRSIED